MSDEVKLAKSFTAKSGEKPLVDGEPFPWFIEAGSISVSQEDHGLTCVTLTMFVDGPALIDVRSRGVRGADSH